MLKKDDVPLIPVVVAIVAIIVINRDRCTQKAWTASTAYSMRYARNHLLRRRYLEHHAVKAFALHNCTRGRGATPIDFPNDSPSDPESHPTCGSVMRGCGLRDLAGDALSGTTATCGI